MVNYRQKSGFSLVEIMTVLMVVAAFAGIVLPRFGFVIERTKMAESLKILDALRSAQIQYSYEHAGAYADNIADLDVTIPASSNFNAISNANINTADPIATVTRSGGSYGAYTMQITANGTITCTGGNSGTCTKLKY